MHVRLEQRKGVSSTRDKCPWPSLKRSASRVVSKLLSFSALTSPMLFEFFKAREVTPAIHREIEVFLDRQNNSHPFQFPYWTAGGSSDEDENRYCAVVRDQGEIRWFAHCGVSFPAGKWLRPIRILTIHRGPVCDDADLTRYGLGKLLEGCKRLGFTYVKIAPDWVEHPAWTVGSTLSRDGWQTLSEGRLSLRLGLNAGTDELLRSFRSDTKLNIRRSEREGVVIRAARNEADIQEFQRTYFEMARKKNFTAEEPKSFLHSLRWIVREEDRGALLLASKEATALGGVLVVRAGMRAWGVFSATVKDTPLTAGHLLQWSAIRWAKDHGCSEYDFGGYREGVNTGPASFKRGFCRSAVQFSPVYRYPLERRVCSILDFVTKAKSKWRTP
jgi:GNAT acetyltransferase-like protein